MERAFKFGYARPEDGAYIAYRVDGDGPIDIVWQPDWPGHIDMEWQDAQIGSWLRELSSFARVITHDHRGVGLSSRNVELPTLETRVSDLLAVFARHRNPSPCVCRRGVERWRARPAGGDPPRCSRARSCGWLKGVPDRWRLYRVVSSPV